MTNPTQSVSALPAGPSLVPLFVTMFITSMGMMGFVTVSGPLADALGLSAIHIGLTVMAGGVGLVISARAWGRAADRFGRRPVLLFGIVGFMLSFLTMALGAHAGLAWGLTPMMALGVMIFGRFFIGLTYAAVPAASNALVADWHDASSRASTLGKMGAAQGAGMLIGPAFVAITAGTSPSAPLFILALMPLIGLVLIMARLPQDKPDHDAPVQPLPLNDPRLFRPVATALLALVSVTIAQVVIGFIAIDRLGLPGPAATRLAGIALTAVGVALIAGQLIIGRLGWSPERLIVVGGSIAAIGFTGAAIAENAVVLVVGYAVAGLGAGWVFPSFNAAAANAVKADEQGRAAGTIVTAIGIAAMVGPFLGGVLHEVQSLLPLLLGAACMAGCVAINLRAARSAA